MPTRLAIAGAALLAVAVTAPSAGRAETPTCQGLAQAPPVEAGATRAWAAEIARAVVDAEARLDLGRPARVELVRSGVAGAWYCASEWS